MTGLIQEGLACRIFMVEECPPTDSLTSRLKGRTDDGEGTKTRDRTQSASGLPGVRGSQGSDFVFGFSDHLWGFRWAVSRSISLQ